MGDIKDIRLLYLKGGLFLLMGVLCVTMILMHTPDYQVALLLGVAIWSFCRAYYFAFYVIGKYIDPSFKFAGLGSVLAYLWRKGKPGP